MLELLRSALAGGTCYLSNKAGREPATGDPDNLINYGWLPRGGRTKQPADGYHDEQVWVPRGDRVGFLTEDNAYLMPPAVMAAVLAAANRADDTFSETAFTLGADMVARGWITPNRNREKTSSHRVGGVVGRYWVLPRTVFDAYGPDGGGPADTRPPLPPAPWPPAEPPTATSAAPAETTTSVEDTTTPPKDGADDQDAAVVAAFELHAPERPCDVCGESTTGQLGAQPVHLPCALDAHLSIPSVMPIVEPVIPPSPSFPLG